MICPDCHGRGAVFSLPPGVNAFEMRLPALANAMQRVPCRTCGGCGLAHCCEGEICQPEPDKREVEDG